MYCIISDSRGFLLVDPGDGGFIGFANYANTYKQATVFACHSKEFAYEVLNKVRDNQFNIGCAQDASVFNLNVGCKA